ncbi:MAG: 4Fe-4S dicluster domain-containing protein [Candidatus Desantisbacteria bacterium]
MKFLKLPTNNLYEFILNLRKIGEVHIPIKKGVKSSVFRKINEPVDIDKIQLDYHRTILPLKKYFYHPTETMFEFSKTGFVQPEQSLEVHDIIFGVHACDIHGVLTLDLVFSGKYRDDYYFNRKKNVSLIGLSCMPDEFCFCNSMATDYVETGFDLFFSEIPDAYLVRVGTSKGDDMLNLSRPLFEEITHEDINAHKDYSLARKKAFKRSLDIRNLPEIMDLEYESNLWDELGNRCTSCGTCSMVCPTCYCYRIFDTINMDMESGQRRRQWDCCLFRDHAMVAGGHNFRQSRSDRFKHRWLHKQQSFAGVFGRPSCVGCGRCIEDCPAKIDIVAESNKIQRV